MDSSSKKQMSELMGTLNGLKEKLHETQVSEEILLEYQYTGSNQQLWRLQSTGRLKRRGVFIQFLDKGVLLESWNPRLDHVEVNVTALFWTEKFLPIRSIRHAPAALALSILGTMVTFQDGADLERIQVFVFLRLRQEQEASIVG